MPSGKVQAEVIDTKAILSVTFPPWDACTFILNNKKHLKLWNLGMQMSADLSLRSVSSLGKVGTEYLLGTQARSRLLCFLKVLGRQARA